MCARCWVVEVEGVAELQGMMCSGCWSRARSREELVITRSIFTFPTSPTNAIVFGFPVVVVSDEMLPPGQVEVRSSSDGRLLGVLTGVGE